MPLPLRETRRQYQQMLQRFWTGEDEALLLSFNQLGMEMIRAGVPPEIAVETHALAMQNLQTTEPAWPNQDNALLLPLMEVIMAYGVNFRQQLADQQAASEAQFYQVLEQSRDNIFITDLQGLIEYANPAFYRATAQVSATVTGKAPPFIDLPDCRPVAEIWQTLKQGQAFRGLVAVMNNQHQAAPWQIRAFPLVRDGGQAAHFVFLAEDVGQQLALKKRLEQSQRLATLGELASGVSHEFNNILLIISGFAELLREDGSGTIVDFADEILKAVDKGRGLNEQILSFASPGIEEEKPVRLGSLIKNIHPLVASAVGKDIRLNLQYPEDLIVTLNEGHLCQILTNLCLNAKHAINDRDDHSEPGWIDCRIFVEQESLIIRLEDNGIGMSQETRAAVFEPFFTTKRTGEGSGLGLSIVLKIVHQYHGRIEVTSEIGRGTQFSLRMRALYPH